MKTASSRLRHRLTLQREVRVDDGAGGYTRSWDDVAEVWGEIAVVASAGGSGKEAVFAGQLQAAVSHRILLRYRDGVTADMRLRFEGRVFNIYSVSVTGEDRQALELWVSEGAAG